MIHLKKEDKGSVELTAKIAFSLNEICSLEELPNNEQVWRQSIRTSAQIISPVQSGAARKQIHKISNTFLTVIYPIMVRQQTLGALSIFWNREQPLTDLDDHIAQVAVNQLAESIERENLRQTANLVVVNDERQRLARELHDSLSQSLYSVSLSADGGEDFARLGDIEKTRSVFKQIKDTIQQALWEMRLLVYELRPSVLSQEGLHRVLQRRLNTVEKRAGIHATFKNDLSGGLLSPHMEAELYGIAQEALNNVVKHSGAESVKISLSQVDGNILMEIKDDGQGFNYSGALSSGGFGLSSMKERVDRIEGKVEFITSPGKGTCVSVRVPITEMLRAEKK